jgi:hypothetical protein
MYYQYRSTCRNDYENNESVADIIIEGDDDSVVEHNIRAQGDDESGADNTIVEETGSFTVM